MRRRAAARDALAAAGFAPAGARVLRRTPVASRHRTTIRGRLRAHSGRRPFGGGGLMEATHKPLVSVVMATCDRAHFLGPAIDSVLKQSAGDLELLIADDGSGEPTRRVLQAWESDPRVRVLWLPHRGNPGAVRNAALQAARGRYVAFQDSDDVWLPDKLEDQLAALAASPGTRWCYTACQHIDSRGAHIEPANISGWSAHHGNIRDAVA